MCCKVPPSFNQLRPDTVSQLHQLTFAIRWQSTNTSLSLVDPGFLFVEDSCIRGVKTYWGASEDSAEVLCLSLPWLLLGLIWHVLLIPRWMLDHGYSWSNKCTVSLTEGEGEDDLFLQDTSLKCGFCLENFVGFFGVLSKSHNTPLIV